MTRAKSPSFLRRQGLSIMNSALAMQGILMYLVLFMAMMLTHLPGSHGQESTSSGTSPSSTAEADDDGLLSGQGNETETETESAHEEVEPATAVLFPAFTLTIGVFVFYVLARYCRALPYTAVMFFIGALMGMGAALIEADDHVNQSVRIWIPIDSEVLLLVFLPGLIYRDAYGLNVHLFRVALTQCIIFAFPLVLAGTVLTALIFYYIFPYGWSFNLCMTVGAILSATDPVAVAALLEQVGAPPRLKVHIAGESLLNDGSAIVFFSIFSSQYLYELGIEGLGEELNWGQGIAKFFLMSVGGACIGSCFGFGLVILMWMFNHRFNREENVVEVSATVAIAYTNYYVAEVVWGTSGVIATVACGCVVKYFGRAIINDPKLMDDFWTLVEHLLNTVLFTLGGAVWGAVISRGEKDGNFVGRDWGYMILLYILLTIVRFFLFLVVFPIIKRIGLKSNFNELIFQVHGGLRGAVGIALALFIDNVVNKEAPELVGQSEKLFAMVGGMAFLTLTINGISAGALLKKLHLADSTEAREKVVKAYRVRFRSSMIDEMVRLLTQTRFKHVNFALVAHHVPYVADLNKQQLLEAVEKHKDVTPSDEYHAPHLQRILPYLPEEKLNSKAKTRLQHLTHKSETHTKLETLVDGAAAEARRLRLLLRSKKRHRQRTHSNLRYMMSGEPLSALEMRLLFISVLRAAYDEQTRRGELEDREFLAIALDQSLEFAADAVANGKPLADWDFVRIVDTPVTMAVNRFKQHPALMRFIEASVCCRNYVEAKRTIRTFQIERSLSFMAAHRYAQSFFHREFGDAESELSEAGKLVIHESELQYTMAMNELHSFDQADVERVVSHKFCTILLNSGVHYVTKLVRVGLLKEDEAEQFVEELEEHLEDVISCRRPEHPGEHDIADEQDESEDEDENDFSDSRRTKSGASNDLIDSTVQSGMEQP